MTTEPRQEAEKIVAQFGHAVRDAAIAWEQGGASQTETEAMWDQERRLVDALAAAIEYDDARGRGNPTHATEEAERKLTEALSALREDET